MTSMEQSTYSHTKKRRDYTPMELELLKESVERGDSLLEIQLALDRPSYGIVKKLRTLAIEDSSTWKREWFARYRVEFDNLNREKLLESKRLYYQGHKQEELIAKQIRRAKKRKMGLRVT